jgi:pimeloyl-ACP methyl ester carboxylesterase
MASDEKPHAILKAIVAFLFTLAFLLLATEPAFADATTSPHQIGYYCFPYTSTYVEGGYYNSPSNQGCTYVGGDIRKDFAGRYGGVFRGTMGNSTMVNAHSLGRADVKEEISDAFPNPQQGEPLFSAIWWVRGYPGTDDVGAFVNYFTNGSVTPPHSEYGFINWKWGVAPPACTQHCYSNVLFLPGIESSRLYRPDGAGGENRIWEPPIVGHDNTQLAMATDGTSVNSDIYTKNALDSALGVDIYGSFLSTMQQFANTNGVTFEAFPYDWRYAADTIASNPVHLAATTTLLTDTVKRLAATSKSGKVTIIAHSNGGLVAKEAMLQLGPDASKYVDKLIFVAVPQVGTPQAIAALLHGYKQGIPVSWAPLLITDAESRTLGRNMPGAYGLLPSAGYFTSVGTPVVTFSTSTLPDWASRYGETIDSQNNNLSFFLSDNAGRTEPIESDLNDPIILSSNLLSQSQSLHQIIDAWVPPAGVQLIQIAGWGVPTTVSGITYSKADGSVKPDANYTIDGDGTVVVPSALWTSATTGTRDYWLDLNDYNNKHVITTAGGLLAVKHANILGIPELITFLSDIITQSVGQLSTYRYFFTESPLSNQPRLRFTLHSPLSLDLYDNFGHHTGVSTTTGLIEERIPGTYYTQFGDVKYLFTDATSSLHIFMDGYATGTFTFRAEELQGDTLIASTTWKDMPTTPETIATIDTSLDLSQNPLHIDKNGDGIVDYTITPKLNDVVGVPKSPLTVTADNETITLDASLPTLTATLGGFVNGDTASTSDVTGISDCTTTATGASPVGNYPIICTIGTLSSNKYDFTTSVPGTLKINYRWSGFLQPIDDTVANPAQTTSVFKGSSTVPVKFQLKNTIGTPVQSVVAPVWITPVEISPMSAAVDESVYTIAGTSGSAYRWDSTNQQYIYNWSTKGLTAGRLYRIYTQLDDGKVYSVVVGLR